MKKNILTVSIAAVLLACNSGVKKENTVHDSTDSIQYKDTVIVADANANMPEFDINGIKESTVELGVFPYLNAPQSYTYNYDKKISTNDIRDFDREYFAVHGRLIPVEGKSFKVRLEKDRSDGKRFNSLIVDKSYEEAILALGGVKVNDVSIPDSEIVRIGDKELIDKKYGHSLDYNLLDDIKTYVIKTKDKEIWIQYYLLNDESGGITILEKGRLNTLAVTKITANQMKSDIEKNGKAILNINFDTDKASLKPDGQEVVKEITALLQSNPTLKLSIEGHTDNSGDAKKNKLLSLDRATNVLNVLVASGVSKGNLRAVGFGAEKPLVANDTEENRAKNRRVELVKF